MAAQPDDPWYVDYGMLVTTVGVMVLGGIYMVLAKPYERGHAPAGDAHLLATAAKAWSRVRTGRGVVAPIDA